VHRDAVDQFQAAIHPDDRQLMHERTQRAREAGDLEHRVVWSDGTMHWLASKGRVLRDAEGRTVRMRGVVRDITESNQAEVERAELQREHAVPAQAQ
jgi:PAS domain S-box-containing protein